MVPNISPNGRSFRGAGAYHLHDRPTPHDVRPRTALRVAFTATRNLANEDPRAALDEMWRTAEDAAYLKSINGAARQGRKNETPVKTISLAWAPGQTPSRAEMIAAADGFLRAMGWQDHQAVYAAHKDTAHPHLHIILNRVHPDTGRALNDWQERKRAQQWALAFERSQGTLLCTARARRYETGAGAPAAGLPYAQAKLIARQSPPARNRVHPETGRTLNDWQERKRAQQWALAYPPNQGAVLCTARAGRYAAAATAPSAALPYEHAKLIAHQSPAARHAGARQTRDAFRPAWARHFRQQRARLADLARVRKTVHRLAASLAREGNAADALDILDSFHRHNARTVHALAAQRAALGRAQYAAVRNRVRLVVPARQRPAGQASAPVRHTSAANDNAAGALDILDRFQRHDARTVHALAAERAALGRAQYAALRTSVHRVVSAGPQSAAHASTHVRRPLAANDNAAHKRIVRWRVIARSGSRLRALLPPTPKPPVNSSRLLRASHRAEQQLLRTMQAAAYAALRRHDGAPRQASSLARSEIALAFAGRWADLQRMPSALRAAAAAALQAEQAAALSARLRYHLMRLRPDGRANRLGLSRQHSAARRALAYRHKLAWAAASAAIKAFRPARAPPVARAGAPLLAVARP